MSGTFRFRAVVLTWACLGASGDAAAQDRLKPIVDGLLSAWKAADIVCLGEGHASRNDADLRLALLRDPRFPAAVDVIVVEFAADTRQALLDRFVLESATLSRDELAPVWRDTRQDVWESPVYEEFLRAVREMNVRLPRAERVRVIAGDAPSNRNRGGAIRTIVAQQVLDKNLKALAIYGSIHCVHVGMGFPGELADRYPGRFWSAYGFFGEKESHAVDSCSGWAGVLPTLSSGERSRRTCLRTGCSRSGRDSRLETCWTQSSGTATCPIPSFPPNQDLNLTRGPDA